MAFHFWEAAGNVLTNDSFGAGATITAVTQGTNGAVTFLADGTVTYTLALIEPISNARLWDPLPPGVDYVPRSITSTAPR